MTLDDPVDHILAAYRIPGPWQPLKATGLANRIYATRDVVLRIATDHSDAIPDARTESVAAPIARSAGILTPELIAFDDSGRATAQLFREIELLLLDLRPFVSSEAASPSSFTMISTNGISCATRKAGCWL